MGGRHASSAEECHLSGEQDSGSQAVTRAGGGRGEGGGGRGEGGGWRGEAHREGGGRAWTGTEAGGAGSWRKQT